MEWNKLTANPGLFVFPTTSAVPAAPMSESSKTAITGSETDDKFSGQVIGKTIPVFLGGIILSGCKLIEGPFITTISGEVFCDYIVSPFMKAVPSATVELNSIRLNGTESFTSADGGVTWTPLGPVFDDVEINVLYGTETQEPFDSSVTRYGARAVPYRSRVCVEIKNVPLAPFNNEIPFLSVEVSQDESLQRRDALSRAAAYARYNSDEYEIEVSGEDDFWIVVDESSFIQFVQELRRTVGRNWNILASDKLYIFENSSTETPVEIDRGDVSKGSIRFWQDPPETIPAERDMGFVDTGRDNDFNVVKAVKSRFPIPLTSSQNVEQCDIPIGMGATQAKIIVNKSLQIDEIARDKCSFKALPHMRGLEPGDLVDLDFDADIEWSLGRIISVARNASDWTSDVVVERINVNLLSTGPSITSNGGGATASITINENTTAVTTVTADQTSTFSISGGDDSSFFTVHPTTGALTITARDFEDPQDSDSNNTYEVIVQALADGLTGTQVITVTIANVIDAGDAPTMDFSEETNSQLIAVIEDF